MNNSYYSLYRNEIIKNNSKKTKFSVESISNNIITNGLRIKFINELSTYKNINMAGNFYNNVGGAVT